MHFFDLIAQPAVFDTAHRMMLRRCVDVKIYERPDVSYCEDNFNQHRQSHAATVNPPADQSQPEFDDQPYTQTKRQSDQQPADDIENIIPDDAKEQREDQRIDNGKYQPRQIVILANEAPVAGVIGLGHQIFLR